MRYLAPDEETVPCPGCGDHVIVTQQTGNPLVPLCHSCRVLGPVYPQKQERSCDENTNLG